MPPLRRAPEFNDAQGGAVPLQTLLTRDHNGLAFAQPIEHLHLALAPDAELDLLAQGYKLGVWWQRWWSNRARSSNCWRRQCRGLDHFDDKLSTALGHDSLLRHDQGLRID